MVSCGNKLPNKMLLSLNIIMQIYNIIIKTFSYYDILTQTITNLYSLFISLQNSINL